VVDSLFGEECDDGTNDGGYGECDVGCVLGPYCGDGVVDDPIEDCDDGNKVGGDGCSAACQSEIN
jgi:cysteine-rich repeat protein